MTRRRLVVAVALAMALLVAIGGFELLNGPARQLEAFLVMAALTPVGDHASVVNDNYFQLLPPGQAAFRAQLTPYCSSLIPILALASIGFFILRGTWLRRVAAIGAGAGLILLCNVVRISGSLWMGYEFGGNALVLFHDWIGTFFALAYTMAGFFLMLYLMLPTATAKVPRAARLSDVL
jgi:exosortase/archaeosortase family protein